MTGEFQGFQLEEKPKKPISLAESRQKIQELQKQIATLEAQEPESPLLPSLYSSLGEAYEERLDNGLVTSHAKEQLLAIQAYEKAIALQTEEDSVELAENLNNLANLYSSQGRYGEAEPLYVRSLSTWEQQLGANHPDVALSLNSLATLYNLQGRYSEAEPLYIQSLGILFNCFGETHPNMQTGWANFLSFLRQVIKAGQTDRLSDHPRTQRAIEYLRQASGEMGE